MRVLFGLAALVGVVVKALDAMVDDTTNEKTPKATEKKRVLSEEVDSIDFNSILSVVGLAYKGYSPEELAQKEKLSLKLINAIPAYLSEHDNAQMFPFLEAYETIEAALSSCPEEIHRMYDVLVANILEGGSHEKTQDLIHFYFHAIEHYAGKKCLDELQSFVGWLEVVVKNNPSLESDYEVINEEYKAVQ